MQRSGFPRRCTFRRRRRRSTSAATSIVGTSPSKASSSPTPFAARARGRAIFRREAKHGMPVAAGHRAPELHGRPCNLQMPLSASSGSAPRLRRSTALRECEPRTRDDRLSTTARFCAGRRPRTEESDATSDRAPAREKPPNILRHRKRRHRGMEIHTTPVALSAEARRRRGPREGPRL